MDWCHASRAEKGEGKNHKRMEEVVKMKINIRATGKGI